MANYHVQWEIDVDADTAEDAARQAFAHMQRVGTTATVFQVYSDPEGDCVTVDLTEIDEERADYETAAINAGWIFRNCAFWHDATNMMYGPRLVDGKPDWKALCAEHGITI